MPLVSVILPTCDRPQLLPRAVRSVLEQTHRELELVLVDSNRRMPPVEIQHAGASWWDPSRIRVVRPAGATNAAAARNAGLSVARGEWITYLDDDDAYRPQKITRQLDLAGSASASLVVCGARFHLRSRQRLAQCDATELKGDELLLKARWNTPLLLHRCDSELCFDEGLDAGEDGHFAQALLARRRVGTVPVVPEPLVDVYQDEPTRDRTNVRAEAGWCAARRIWRDFGGSYSRRARRVFVIRALIARAKLKGNSSGCLRLAPGLLRVGGVSEWRYAANALLVSTGLAGGRFVT